MQDSLLKKHTQNKTGKIVKMLKYKALPLLPWSLSFATCHDVFYLLLNVILSK